MQENIGARLKVGEEWLDEKTGFYRKLLKQERAKDEERKIIPRI